MSTATWRKAGCDSGNCAEVKDEGERVYVRSSLNHQLVTFTKEEWDAFKQSIKNGEFDQ
jgi:DNA-binding transcriptional regulator/RsmH inhibitor MraZ